MTETIIVFVVWVLVAAVAAGVMREMDVANREPKIALPKMKVRK